MAWLERDARTGFYKVGFRLGNRRFKKSLRTTSVEEAQEALGVTNETLRAVERGWATIPQDVDVGEYVLSGGRLTAPLNMPKAVQLHELFEAYFASLPDGALEQSTISVMRIHERQLCRVLGRSTNAQALEANDLQRFVRKRSQEPGRRGRKVKPATIRKALLTLRTVWNWGVANNHLTGPFPKIGLKFPKSIERPCFQTWKEIEQQIVRGGLSEAEQSDLWDCLFLTLDEIAALLLYAKEHAGQPWVYPAICLAAHTGARRSEIVRSKLNDVDLVNGVLTVQERKRNHETSTTRRVPISPFLADVLSDWINRHPGGLYTFCQVEDVRRSKTVRRGVLPITRDEAHDHFKRTFAGSRWSVLRGWHVFRHSFCSNCAAKGLDQRIINTWVGHQTEDMVRRYRHLFPDQQQSAIRAVFGENGACQRT
jgi:integrase